MKEERLLILNLLNDGKINVDEAAKLLDALNTASEPKKGKHKHHSASYSSKFDEYDFEEKFKKFSQSVDSFSKDVSERVSVAYKEFEPKFRKTAKTVMEKTAAAVDDLAKTLNESVKNMEEKMKAACEEECCDTECCGDEPKEN